MADQGIFQEADVIFSYTREQAIADGAFIDVTESAQTVGARFDVAITAAGIWADVVQKDSLRLDHFLMAVFQDMRNREFTGGLETEFKFTFRRADGVLVTENIWYAGEANQDGTPAVNIFLPSEY
jgi:hypothetical protein